MANRVSVVSFACIGALLLTSAEASIAHSFTYGGVSADLTRAKIVQSSENAKSKRVIREWMSPDGLLILRSTEIAYRQFPVVEYIPELIATTNRPTDIVADFHSLAFNRTASFAKLRALKGTVNTDEDFRPFDVVFGPQASQKCAYSLVAAEGRSSAQFMPWFGLDFPEGDGVDVGIGWSGAWRADFSWKNGAFEATAGLVKTHFRLLPGERIRQPSLLVFNRRKDVSPLALQTIIHRFMIENKCPRNRKGELLHGIAALTVGGGNKTPQMMKKVIDWKVRNDMPFDCFWVDAGWNGPAHKPDLIANCGDMWWKFVGDWRFNPTIHPDGDLGKVADLAHAAKMRMLLWMEPERCVAEPAPPVFLQHRDWILPRNDKDIRRKTQLCIDLGNPDAFKWVLETASDHVRRCKLDVFRQDFNINTLPLWQANDAKDRQGITETKHVMGLWKFWDALRERFPHLMIENCASGGRRLDFEAVSRAHSYCRTDYAIYHRDPSQITDVQNATLNTLAYLPFQGSESTPALFFDDYGLFSSFASGLVFTPSDWNAGIVKNDFDAEQVAWFKSRFSVGKRMMPYYEGEFYPLTDNRVTPTMPKAWEAKNSEEMKWCAWQMHRTDLNAGFVIAFRRLNAPSSVFRAELKGIDPSSRYEVETFGGETRVMSGSDFRNFSVKLISPRSFQLQFYRLKGNR